MDRDIELLVLDVDGVLTDGSILMDAKGRTLARFHVRDGTGIKYWMRAGGKVALLSGNYSHAVAARARELGIRLAYLGYKRKLPAFEDLLVQAGVPAARTAYIGDDLPDLPCMRHCGFSAAVADACEEVKAAADLIATRPGGAGAVREVIEILLKQMGKWDRIMERYR